MGGKRLKFPSRQKYRPPEQEAKKLEEEKISEEEHEKRVKMLKELGLIK